MLWSIEKGDNVGVDVNNGCLVFRDGYPNGGYKLSSNGNAKTVRIKFTDDTILGEYNLVPCDEELHAWKTVRAK